MLALMVSSSEVDDVKVEEEQAVTEDAEAIVCSPGSGEEQESVDCAVPQTCLMSSSKAAVEECGCKMDTLHSVGVEHFRPRVIVQYSLLRNASLGLDQFGVLREGVGLYELVRAKGSTVEVGVCSPIYAKAPCSFVMYDQGAQNMFASALRVEAAVMHVTAADYIPQPAWEEDPQESEVVEAVV